MIFVDGPLRWVLFAGAVLLPYVAVIVANQANQRQPSAARPGAAGRPTAADHRPGGRRGDRRARSATADEPGRELDGTGTARLPDLLLCSAKDCRAPATYDLRWNNPKIHPPERRKHWLACPDHRDSLSAFLSLAASAAFPAATCTGA